VRSFRKLSLPLLLVAAGLTCRPAQAENGLTLAQALKIALGGSPDVLVEQARIAAAEKDEDREKAAYYPTIHGGLTASGSAQTDVFALNEPHYKYVRYVASGSGSADLEWMLSDFGKTANGVAASGKAILAAQQTEQAVRGQVVKQTADAFVQVAYDEEDVESRRTSLKNRTRFALFAQALVQKGVKAGIDEVRARLNVEAAKHALAQSESKLLEDRAKLAILLQMDPRKLGAVVKPTMPALDNEDPQRAAAQAIKSRPEVTASERNVEASDKRVDEAKSAYYPTLSFGLTGSVGAKRYDSFDSLAPSRQAAATLTLSFPILDPHIWTSVHYAEAEAALTRAKDAKVKRDVTNESEIAVIELQSAKSIAARAKELSTIAEGVLTVMEARYQAGIATPIELVDAEQNDIEAKEALVAANLKADLAAVQLLVSTTRWSMLQK
jgi:multidrug efflux system outer membrane protein